MMKLISFIALCSIPVTLSFAPSPPNVYSNRQTLAATRTICPPRLTTTCSSFPRRQAITTAPNLLPWPFQQKHSNRLFVSLLNDENDEQMESWEDDSKDVELVLLLSWAVSISAFILVNNFIGPWPQALSAVPERLWFVLHMLGGMLFGGGVILTTAIEWLVAHNRNSPVLSFWFDKVPLLDAAIVLPALTVAMVSGTGLATEHYGGLGLAPPHIPIVFYALVGFALWWGLTDLTTQGKALVDVNEWSIQNSLTDNEHSPPPDVPQVVHDRKISNIVSCLFIIALYAIMVFKPGTLIWKDGINMML